MHNKQVFSLVSGSKPNETSSSSFSNLPALPQPLTATTTTATSSPATNHTDSAFISDNVPLQPAAVDNGSILKKPPPGALANPPVGPSTGMLENPPNGSEWCVDPPLPQNSAATLQPEDEPDCYTSLMTGVAANGRSSNPPSVGGVSPRPNKKGKSVNFRTES